MKCRTFIMDYTHMKLRNDWSDPRPILGVMRNPGEEVIVTIEEFHEWKYSKEPTPWIKCLGSCAPPEQGSLFD
jgi:hypothetical protein